MWCFGIGCDVCCRMLGRSQTLFFLRTDMAPFSCTSTLKDALKKHQASQHRKKSVLEELCVNVCPMATRWSGRRLEVFSEVLATLQSGANAKKIDRGDTRGRLKNSMFCLLEAKQETD